MSITKQHTLLKQNALINKHHAALLPLYLTHPAIRETWRMLPAKHARNAWMDADSRLPTDSPVEVRIGLMLRDLPSFKAPALQRLLARFCGDEWTASTKDWPTCINRDFHFKRYVPLTTPMLDKITRHPSRRWLSLHAGKNPGADTSFPVSMCVHVIIGAYVRSDSPTCRSIVTGIREETIRTEVREIICA